MQVPRSSLLLLLLSSAAAAACSSSPSQANSATTTGPGGTGGHHGTGGSGVGAGDVGGGGGTGGTPVVNVSCAWSKQTSNATCPSGPCPIVLDEELSCADTEFAAPGLRVAPAPDATWVATSSTNDRIVYRLDASGAERQDGVPKLFLRTTIALALAPDGTVHLGADTTQTVATKSGPLAYVGGATYATAANGAWTSSLVSHDPDAYTPVVDLDVGGDGVPRMWVLPKPPDAYAVATPKANGWSLANAPVPEAGAWNRFTLAADGSIVSLSAEGTSVLHALVGGKDRVIGSSITDFNGSYAITAAPAPAAPSGPLFAVAIADLAGIHVLGEPASGAETETLVAGAISPVPTCNTPDDVSACSGTCHETGVGMEDGAFALAWTDDGVAWLAYVVTSFDQTISYSVQEGDPGLQFCLGNVAKDSSLGTLHLMRVPLDGSAATEALTMPIARPGGGDAFLDLNQSVRFVDARGFGKDLAIGVRTGWFGGPNAVRVLRLDTTKL